MNNFVNWLVVYLTILSVFQTI